MDPWVSAGTLIERVIRIHWWLFGFRWEASYRGPKSFSFLSKGVTGAAWVEVEEDGKVISPSLQVRPQRHRVARHIRKYYYLMLFQEAANKLEGAFGGSDGTSAFGASPGVGGKVAWSHARARLVGFPLRLPAPEVPGEQGANPSQSGCD